MTLKYVPKKKDLKPLESLRNKIQSAEVKNFKDEVDEAVKLISKELQKLRNNPIIKLFNELSPEEQNKLISKLKKESHL